MLFLGLLLVVASAAATALLVAYNSSGGPEQMIVLFGQDMMSVSPLQAFLSGIVIAIAFCLGVWMMVGASRRSRAVRSEYKAVRREARDAARERDKLADELAKERATTVEPERTADAAATARTEARAAEVERPTPQERGRTLAERFRRSRRAEQEAQEVDETTTRAR